MLLQEDDGKAASAASLVSPWRACYEASDMHLQPGPFAEGWTGCVLEGFLHGERAVFTVAAVSSAHAQVGLFKAMWLLVSCLMICPEI